MESQDLIKLYEEKKKQFRAETYQHISNLLKEAKEMHKKDFLKSETAKKAIVKGRQPDHEQSWRAFKGKGLEKLAVHIIKDEVEKLGLKVIEGNTLERTNSKNLPEELSRVKRNLLIDYGEFGAHLPDVDIIIYEPETCNIIAVISSKVTLRERIAQTGYWKIKLSQDEITKHIKVFFITPDEDRTLSIKTPAKKGRAIVEIDTDGSYIMSEEEVEESDKVKKFDKFLVDLKNLIYAKRNKK
jgi:type II restriction enzyme